MVRSAADIQANIAFVSNPANAFAFGMTPDAFARFQSGAIPDLQRELQEAQQAASSAPAVSAPDAAAQAAAQAQARAQAETQARAQAQAAAEAQAAAQARAQAQAQADAQARAQAAAQAQAAAAAAARDRAGPGAMPPPTFEGERRSGPNGEDLIGQSGQWFIAATGQPFGQTAGASNKIGGSAGGSTSPTGGGATTGDAPAGWPPGITFPPKKRIRSVDPITGAVTMTISDEIDSDAIVNIMRAFGIGGFAPKTPQQKQASIQDLVSKALQAGDFELARQIVNASQGGSGFQPSPTVQQQLERALADALANGNDAEVKRIQALINAPTSLQLSQEARLAAQEGRAARGFETSQEFARSAETRAATRAELENRLATARNEREAQAARSELARLDAQESRAAQAFPLSQQLLRNQDTRAAAEQAFSQGLQSRQFGLQAQGQAFGQAQQRLQSGLDILRSPGDFFLYQSRLRGNQPNQAFQLGGTAVSRNAFLEPFGQQAFGGGQGQAAQQFGSLLQPEGTQTPSTPFGIGSGLQQAFSGQAVDQPRLLTSLGAPPFLNLQQNRNLLPSEREMRRSEIQAQGFYLPDFEEQERRQNPRAFRTSSQPFRTAAAPRAF